MKRNRFHNLIAVIIAQLLLCLCLLGGVACENRHTSSSVQNSAPSYTAISDNVIVEEQPNVDSTNNIRVKLVQRATNDSTTTSYTVTATVSDLSSSLVNMSVAWKNPSSTWASGKTVTNYVTITQSSSGSTTGTLKCIQAFGEQVILTVTARADTSKKATATVDYVKRVSSVLLTPSCGSTTNLMDNVFFTATPTYGVGTLTGTLSYGALNFVLNGNFIMQLSISLSQNTDFYDFEIIERTSLGTLRTGASYTFPPLEELIEVYSQPTSSFIEYLPYWFVESANEVYDELCFETTYTYKYNNKQYSSGTAISNNIDIVI